MTNFVVAGTQFVRNLLILQENIIGGRSAPPQGAAFVLKRELVGNRLRSRCTVGTTPPSSMQADPRPLMDVMPLSGLTLVLGL